MADDKKSRNKTQGKKAEKDVKITGKGDANLSPDAGKPLI